MHIPSFACLANSNLRQFGSAWWFFIDAVSMQRAVPLAIPIDATEYLPGIAMTIVWFM
jgi:hypothetical protein